MAPSHPLQASRSSANTDSNTIVLFSTTTQKLSYISAEELRQLKMRKFVHGVEIPLLALNMDIYMGLEGEKFWGNVELPGRGAGVVG